MPPLSHKREISDKQHSQSAEIFALRLRIIRARFERGRWPKDVFERLTARVLKASSLNKRRLDSAARGYYVKIKTLLVPSRAAWLHRDFCNHALCGRAFGGAACPGGRTGNGCDHRHIVQSR